MQRTFLIISILAFSINATFAQEGKINDGTNNEGIFLFIE